MEKLKLYQEQELMKRRMRGKRSERHPEWGGPRFKGQSKRGKRVEDNELERTVREFLVRKGWKVLRSGWPDFLVFKGDTPILVEVKSTNDRLSSKQKEMHAALKKMGLEVMVVYPEKQVLHEVFGVEC